MPLILLPSAYTNRSKSHFVICLQLTKRRTASIRGHKHRRDLFFQAINTTASTTSRASHVLLMWWIESNFDCGVGVRFVWLNTSIIPLFLQLALSTIAILPPVFGLLRWLTSYTQIQKVKIWWRNWVEKVSLLILIYRKWWKGHQQNCTKGLEVGSWLRSADMKIVVIGQFMTLIYLRRNL